MASAYFQSEFKSESTVQIDHYITYKLLTRRSSDHESGQRQESKGEEDLSIHFASVKKLGLNKRLFIRSCPYDNI